MEIIIISSALLISAVLNILFQREFIKRNILDKINSRSSHQSVATRSGGSSIFSSLFFISIFFYLNNNEIYDFSLLIPLSIMLVVGLYDDIYRLDFLLKFIFQKKKFTGEYTMTPFEIIVVPALSDTIATSLFDR